MHSIGSLVPRLCSLLVAGFVLLPVWARAQPPRNVPTNVATSAADSAAIRALVLDYALGWYDGEPARMERALHPRLAKRSIVHDSAGRDGLMEMTVERLVGEARSGVGRQIPANVRRTDVKILDVFGDIASVRGDMHGWVDYFQVARIDGQWKVINVLWAMRPGYQTAPPVRRSGL